MDTLPSLAGHAVGQRICGAAAAAAVLSCAAAVLVAHPGATIIGGDVDCGQQKSKLGSPVCKVCRHGVDVIEAACRRMPACVAFVYDDASGCADLKVSAAAAQIHQ
jgi:hypothetical protein